MKLSNWIWSICLLILPLIMINALIDAVTIPRLSLLLFGTMVCNGLLLSKEKEALRAHSSRFFKSVFGISLLAYFVVGLLSLTQAHVFADGLTESLKILAWINVIFISSFLFQESTNQEQLFKASLMAIFIVTGIACFEFLSILDHLDENKILYTVNSTFEHKNLLATGLLLGLPICFFVFVESKAKHWKGLATLTAIMAFFIIIVTQSRAAWLSLLGSFVGCLILIGITRNKYKKLVQPKVLLTGLLCSIIGLSLMYQLNGSEAINNAPLKRIEAVFSYEETKNEHTETIQERFQLWDNSIQMAKEHPLLGVGLGNWKVHFPKYSMEGLRSEQGQVFFQRPHNDYLWLLSEVGFLGLIAYLMIFGSILFYLFQALRRSDELSSKEYWGLLFSAFGLFAFVIFSVVDFPKERPIHLLWSGLLMAYVWNLSSALKSKDNKVQPSNLWIPYLLLGLSGLGLLFMGKRWQSELHAKKALEARSESDYGTDLSELEQAYNWTYTLDPAATPLAWYKGEALYLQEQYPQALEAFLEAQKVHPNHTHTLNNLGATYFALNQLEEAQKYFEQVLVFAPQFPDANMNLSALAYNKGKIGLALKYIGNCQPSDYQEPRFLQFLGVICGAYAQTLATQSQLSSIQTVLEEFKTKTDWQIAMHQQAKQHKRTLLEQIKLDLLYSAKEQQLIDPIEEKKIAQFINSFSI